jgi:hypothetical protein
MQGDAGRERFFFARRGAAHYGIVRWDNAVKRDGAWVVTDRTVGLRVGSQPPAFSFEGLLDRARRTVGKDGECLSNQRKMPSHSNAAIRIDTIPNT